jgi:serine/threonine protein kinase
MSCICHCQTAKGFKCKNSCVPGKKVCNSHLQYCKTKSSSSKHWKLLEGDINDMFTFDRELFNVSLTRVWLAHNAQNQVVIKQVPLSSRVSEEIATLMYLKENCREFLLCFEEAWADDQFVYIVTEALQGFRDMVGIQVPFDLVSEVLGNMVHALYNLHQLGVAHGDIKPDNLLASTSTGQVKIIDFGFACMNERCESRPVKMGTELYMAPELFVADPFVGKNLHLLQSTDIFSMGLCVLEFLSGKVDFDVWFRSNVPTGKKRTLKTESEWIRIYKVQRVFFSEALESTFHDNALAYLFSNAIRKYNGRKQTSFTTSLQNLLQLNPLERTLLKNG